ncbi:2Fe-2S iron-sulfur cluster binding domain-containing protein [Sphingomonas sp. ID1715]|uniref:2Fe-2S iron-sulfur cluster-binding protein n=1 Tax=Sphingomonas sp. ID1715 TaxID=1656898 RepID=UPI001488AAC7|nr:2Fe-2S iron-sulfur cluster binding domain-containing protein [Sphingomonas sp. ID1715]
MRQSSWLPASLFSALAAVAIASPALAQEGSEHSAHHESSPAAPMGAGAGAQPASGSGMSGMMGSMGSMDEGEHGDRRQNPFFAQLLAIPPIDARARQELRVTAADRVHQGLKLIGEGSAAGMHADTPAQQLDAARQLREGVDLFRSGSAAQAALAGSQPPSKVAADWFRDQLSIEPPMQAHTDFPVGLSPAHLLLMLFLLAVSGSLIGLQWARTRRIRRIVTDSQATGAPPAHAPAAAASAPGPISAKVASAAPASAPFATFDALPPSNAASPAGASLRRPKPWTGSLRVVQIVRETPTVQTFRLADPSADRLPFDFLPGQFLQVEVEPESGKPARRSYTIASSPTQRAFVELTVKREQQGVVSCYLHDTLKVGDLLKISGPFGAFTFTGTDADSIVLIAGGVGITPMMSVLRYLTDTAWSGEIFFLYGARSTEEFVFRDELERLERRHENLHVLGVMKRAPGTVWLGPEGNITKEMLVAAVPDIARRRIHLCGPPPMMAAIKAQLAELGVAEAQLHTEAFGPASLPVEPVEVVAEPTAVATEAKSAESLAGSANVAATTITFSVAGVSAALPAGQTVLEAAEGAGVEIPYACRVGECGVCVVKLLDGEVTMAVETGLAPSDKANGYVLACQAKSTGKPLVVEA